ncbi:MAG: transposase zinc-binding domain-containing protein [Thomasclavelia ramosa]
MARIFYENKGRLLYDFELARKGLRSSVMKAINLIILCFLHDLGHSLYECPNCENFTFVRHTCKSRFCISCGMNYRRFVLRLLWIKSLTAHEQWPVLRFLTLYVNTF